MDESYVKSLSVSLPPELEELKYAGYFDEFTEKAKYHLNREDLPEIVKNRIILEIHNQGIIRREYTMTEKQVFNGIAKYLPGFTEDDFAKLSGDVDYVFINGRKRYANFSVSSLFITSRMLREWPGSTYPKDTGTLVADARKLMKKNGKATVSHDLEFTCRVSKKAAEGCTLRVHLPYPNPECDGIKNIEFISSTGKCRIAPVGTLQRTAFFEVKGDEQREFSVRVKADCKETYMSYSDLLKAQAATTPAKEKKLRKAVRPSDLAEKAPHLVFTPFIKALSAKIVGNEKNKTKIAKRIYTYLTHEYSYAYVRDYAAIDNIGEYFGIRGRGDCGLQAALFITLCRYNGIPARWESGVCTDGSKGGCHDWCLIYLEGVGFRPVDVSFGGGAVRRNSKADNDFYFGNIDPYRMKFNTDFQEPFKPAKHEFRVDPYDNQRGEAETQSDMLTRREARFDCIVRGKTIK